MVVLKHSKFILTIIFFLLAGCNHELKEQISFNKRYLKLISKYAPDKSLSINEISLKIEENKNSVVGKTNEKEIFQYLKLYSDSMSYQFLVSMLPDSSLRDSIYGIVNVSVTAIREKPNHSSQMVDQAILGNYVRLYEKIGDWYLCQTEYDYVGWINKTAIHLCNENDLVLWTTNSSHIVSALNSTLYTKPDDNSLPVTDLVLNNIIQRIGIYLEYSKFCLPDGREGFLLNSDFNTVKMIGNNNSAVKIIEKAKELLGTPYLWGGNSTKGSDCSGFTQLLFKSEGFFLPRDARQQASLGKKINIHELLQGDLIFFGSKEKVTHVGISLGGYDYIHQGGKVEIHSLDEKSKIFNSSRAKTYMFAKRILN
jgi:hypothetical protein